MTIPMALLDYVPVAFFIAASVIFIKCLYNKMDRGSFALYAAGQVLIGMGGFYKATWKLLYAANVCDFTRLTDCFFPMQATGFVLGGVGMWLMFRKRKGGVAGVAAAPAVFKGTMLLAMMNVVGCAALNAGYGVLALRLKRKGVAALFALSFLLSVAMGYLSSRDSADPLMNWIDQSVNTAGQGLLLAGAVLLRRAGLAQLELKR